MNKKIVLFIITFLIVLLISTSFVYADIVDPEAYRPGAPSEEEVKPIMNWGNEISGIVLIVGNIVSVGALIVIGIRYMISSVEEKAEYKERLIPYVIGASILFVITNILGYISEFASKIGE